MQCPMNCFFTSNNKVLDWSKLKALAADKINVTEKLKLIFRRVESILAKEKNTGYQWH